MRVTLYIAGQEVELDDNSLILYNYSLEDMSNPTIVENSYSQSIEIQGTPQNNKIFGELFRLDRVTEGAAAYTGKNFDPTRKTPFTLCDSTGAQIESGYIKLDSMSKDVNGNVTYKVTLYGGLGSFLYGLMYTDNGDKKTLADLQYLDTQDPSSELTFAINKTNVADAWSNIPSSVPATINNKWQVINFAPCYNGIPSGNFSADKALIIPSDHGLADEVSEAQEGGGTKYWRTRGGYALMTMGEEHTEWHCKDLRSYLQRPVLYIGALLRALAKNSNNNGYSVDLSDIIEQDYANTWLTLPLFPDLGTYKQTSGALTANITSAITTERNIGNITLVGGSSLASGTTVTAKFSLNLKMQCDADDESPLVFRQTKYRDSSAREEVAAHCGVGFLQLLAYDADGNMVGGSNINVIGDLGLAANATQCALNRGYSPLWQDDTTVFNVPYSGVMIQGTGNEYTFSRLAGSQAIDLVFECVATDVIRYEVDMRYYSYVIEGGASEHTNPTHYDGPTLWLDEDVYASMGEEIGDLECDGSKIARGSADRITYTSSESLRSNATITKQMLLTTDATPADYLLSLCKCFGWYLVYDQLDKSVAIKTRNNLFSNTIIDLSSRIATDKGIAIKPYAIEAKWYDFKLEQTGGYFADLYESTQGRAYGMKRLNTGYEFNSENKDLLDNVVFKSGVPSLETDKYNCTIMNGNKYIPSVFRDSDNKYTLWTSDGESKDIDISQPKSNLPVTWMNERHGYDIAGAWKMQYHDDSNGYVEGAGCLVFYNGKKTYSKFKLTDDLSEMNQVNDGQPCWILGIDSQNPSLDVPIFSAYKQNGTDVRLSLDFGVPAELNTPDIQYDESTTIYATGWKQYLTDKYNKDTKVLTVYVDFRGMKVGQDLLRQFYYFDGTIWIVNKITNYSMTTYDPCKVELVKVQDIQNYINGQDYE